MGNKASISHLSEKRYGYDVVVATTQESINAVGNSKPPSPKLAS